MRKGNKRVGWWDCPRETFLSLPFAASMSSDTDRFDVFVFGQRAHICVLATSKFCLVFCWLHIRQSRPLCCESADIGIIKIYIYVAPSSSPPPTPASDTLPLPHTLPQHRHNHTVTVLNDFMVSVVFILCPLTRRFD